MLADFGAAELYAEGGNGATWRERGTELIKSPGKTRKVYQKKSLTYRYAGY